MKISAVTTFCTLILLISCGHKNATMIKLGNIDSLNSNGLFDSAYHEIMSFDKNNLRNNEEKAYYYLLKSEILVTNDCTIHNSSMIDFSISHYEKHGDMGKLAKAYYYKGVILYDKGDNINGMLFIKKAESTEKKAGDPMLRFMININMAYLNVNEKANKTGLEYARKALADAEAIGSTNLICMALNNIAMCHYYIGNKDSVLQYMEKAKQYVHKIPSEKDRAVVLTNIGVIYYDFRMYKEAAPLFRQAVALLPISTTQINLAKNNYALGNDDQTDSLLKKSWPKANHEEKAEIMQFLAERAERQGDFKASARFYKEAKAMQDSADAVKETEEAVNVQREYETKEYKQGVAKSKVVWAITTVVAVALLAAWGAVYHRRKMNRAKEMIERGNKLTAEYTARITELERADSRHSHEAQELRRKIKKLKDEQNAILSRGQQLYNGIMAGGTTATWKKQDFDEFIEFYRVAHPQAVADAENGYRRLSSTNIFYLILRDMQVADDDAQRILCMTAGAMRTMKSRINARKTD